MEGTLAYCVSKDVQFGGYKEFDHEPTASEVAETVSKILDRILDSIVIRKLDATEVILKTPEDYKRMSEIDPLFKFDEKRYKEVWTVGVKISCKDAGYSSPCKFKLDEGVSRG